MAKEKESWFDISIGIIITGILLISGITMPLKESSHRKITGVISQVETRYGKRKTRPSKIFRLKRKHIYHKDRQFSNIDLHSRFSSRHKLNALFKEGKNVSFHVDKNELEDNIVRIYSLEIDGKIIVSLRSKWKLKLTNFLLGLFFLFSLYLSFVDD